MFPGHCGAPQIVPLSGDRAPTWPLFLSTLHIQVLRDESIGRGDSQADSQRGHRALSAFPICLLGLSL